MPPSKQYGCVAAHASGRATLGTTPTEGLKPKQPHHAAGMRMEPPPSVPCAIGTSPSATAAALPPDEPPELQRVSKGVDVGP